MNGKKYSRPPSQSSYEKLEDVIGCKWSVSVLQAISEGIARPGALERHIEGISTKVLNERLRKLCGYGLLSKSVYTEVPLRTEYSLTPDGEKLVSIIRQIHSLDDRMKSAEHQARKEAPGAGTEHML